MSILITGNTGFVGRRLTQRLIKQGYMVYGLSRLKTTKSLNISAKNFRQLKGDITSFEGIKKVLQRIKDIEMVFHLATVHPKGSPLEIQPYFDINLKGMVNILKICLGFNIRYLIAGSTFSVYGKPKYLPIDEKHPTYPLNTYALTKWQSEMAVEFFTRKTNLKAIILRYDGVWGPGQRQPGLIQYLLKNFLKNREVILFDKGKRIRDYVFVDDVVQANIQAAKFIKKTKFDIFNIGGGHPRMSLETANIIKNMAKSDSKIKLSHKKNPLLDFNIFMDINKARRILGYKPNKLKDNITKWLRENEERT